SAASVAEQNLSNYLEALLEWADNNDLVFNTSKFVLFFPFNHPFFPLQIDNISIPPSKNLRYLGLNIGSNLSLSEHVQLCCAKMRRMSSFIFYLSNRLYGVRTNTLLKIYRCYIRPIGIYASACLFPLRSSSISLLDRTERRILRKIY